MANQDNDTNAEKASLEWGLSCKLQASFVDQVEELQDFTKFIDLCNGGHG